MWRLSPGRLQRPQYNWAVPRATCPVGIISTLNSIKLLYSCSVRVTSQLFDDVLPACVTPPQRGYRSIMTHPYLNNWEVVCVLFFIRIRCWFWARSKCNLFGGALWEFELYVTLTVSMESWASLCFSQVHVFLKCGCWFVQTLALIVIYLRTVQLQI